MDFWRDETPIAGPLVIPPGKPLRLRYGLWVHPNAPDGPTIERQWRSFASQPLASLEMTKPPKKQQQPK